MAKKEMEKKEELSKLCCSRCDKYIQKDDIKFARQSDNLYLCQNCRAELEKIQKE
ncbi:MAG: hypothetical protein ACI4LX_06450 [Treponema sp.]